MFNQHAKWLRGERRGRRGGARSPASTTCCPSHVWRQDHNGFTHQDPGFLDVVMNKKPEVVRVYLPPDANTLLSTYDHCLRSRHYVNVVVAGKQPQADWLSRRGRGAALRPRRRDLGVGRHRASTGSDARRGAGLRRRRPDAGDARRRRRSCASGCRTCASGWSTSSTSCGCCPSTEHPHGLPDREFDTALHRRPAGDLRLPRLPVAGAPAHLPPPQPRAAARPRLQGERHDHHAVRHGDAQRPRPLPPGHRRHRPGARRSAPGPPGCASRWSTPGCGPGPGPASTARTCPRSRSGRGRARPGRPDAGAGQRATSSRASSGSRSELRPRYQRGSTWAACRSAT